MTISEGGDQAMTRGDFAQLLRGQLRGLNGEEVEKSIQFYDELIVDHMEEGLSEEEAVRAVGTPGEIAREILMEMPVTTLVRRRVKKRPRFRGFAAVLIVLGMPVWLPLLLTAVILTVVVVLLAYLLVFMLGASLWAVVLAVAAVAIAAVLSFTFSAGGFLSAGIALAGAGATVLLTLGMIEVTKWCIAAWRGLARAMKRFVVGRSHSHEK